MKKLLVILTIVIAAALISGCGGAGTAALSGGGGGNLEIKAGGQSLTLKERSGGVYYGNVISTAPGKPNIQTWCHDIMIANYEMDTTNMATMKKPLAAPDQMRVWITLTGKDGTNTQSPFEVGTYDAAGDKINEVRAVIVTRQVDGKDKNEDFDTMSSMSKIAGTVKLTSVTADSIAGEIDVTEGDKSVKGTFTAKLPVKK